ncbi:zinc finger and SCAN domain-containing protein 29-like [Rhizophagus clarus]|uniref:Zinc finger and SCAN domain-containing protein 29-like n=1 Tax=Rhizophagus clarus TaxID=94130 RepID=A0A8H3LT75_9GLOM|nr:zinc finger and SCAN domain-containing protein 29-like [Rhizophagus clarus]
MNQIQVNKKTSTVERANTNFYKPSKKKIATHLTTTSRTNLPRSVLAEQQVQQQILPPVLSQQDAFLQHTHPQQHVGRDEAEEDGDCDQYQDPSDEKSGSKWGDDEIKVLLDYIQENFLAWSKGNKTKFYNDMMKNVLFNKEANAIKSKLARLIKMYESIKKHNNQTGNERKDWCWYDKMDMIFGVRENITPSFLANKETGTLIEEEIVEIKDENKKQKHKSKNNVEVIAMAIAEMS